LDKRLVEQQYTKLEGMERTKSYFSILATLILLITLLLLIFPAIKHITSVNKELSDARYVKASLEKKLEALQTARENYKEAQPDLPILDLALPVGSDLVTYLKKIESLAAASNLKVVAVQFSNVPLYKPTVKEALKTKKLPYSLTFTGNFLDFQKFLIDVESYVRTSDVLGIRITREQDGSLQDTLNITSYYLGLDSVPAGTKTSKSTTQPTSGESGSGGTNE
jgi:Tfp pilus assembly protein PilO